MDEAGAVLIADLPSGKDRAQWLLSFLLDQPLEGYERSIKFGRDLLLDQRFLGGIAYSRLQRAGVLAICHRLGMPPALIASLAAESDEPDIVHFGYEGGARQDIFKVYFEFARRAVAAGKETSFILHRAFKWDARAPEHHAVASYRCIVGLDLTQQRQRAAAMLDGSPLRSMICEILDLALPQGLPQGDVAPMYLEVGEEGNSRSSFDVNLHAAVLPFSSIRPVLVKHQHVFDGLPVEAIENILLPLETRHLGHLSAGISRGGQDFFTLYYDPFA